MNFPANPFWAEPTVDVGEPREDTNHEARAARLADELDAMRRECDGLKASLANMETAATVAYERLESERDDAERERDQLKTDLLELRGIVRSYLHGATELERTLALSVLTNTIRPEQTGLRLVEVAPTPASGSWSR
jgi:hypothetical protein